MGLLKFEMDPYRLGIDLARFEMGSPSLIWALSCMERTLSSLASTLHA